MDSIAIRPAHLDVTHHVDVTNPELVCAEVMAVLGRRYPGADLSLVPIMFRDFAQLYRGENPLYHGCDIGYHDLHHVLDVTLAMVRLIDGYESQAAPDALLGARRALLGTVCALFHDAGYIRARGDTLHSNGAEYTRVHVTRSAEFLADYLPSIGLADEVALCAALVHFTGYERDPDTIPVPSVLDRELGALLGTADLIAQMADGAYIDRCRDRLYPEFERAGMTGEGDYGMGPKKHFKSADHLLAQTPEFIRSSIEVRLDGYFHRAYRYAAVHFGGPNLYMEALPANCRHLETLLNDRGLDIDTIDVPSGA